MNSAKQAADLLQGATISATQLNGHHVVIIDVETSAEAAQIAESLTMLPTVQPVTAEAEREACAKIVDGWVGMFQSVNPKYVTPQQWAVDAMEDVAEAIRARGN